VFPNYDQITLDAFNAAARADWASHEHRNALDSRANISHVMNARR
jgi:hypothetical protein